MIGQLNGTLCRKKPPHLLVDVQGVGYELEASMNTCFNLPEQGESVLVYTHLVIRDDAHLLYGFADEQERKLFRALLKVSGIGPKSALAILSSISPDEFVTRVMEEDTSRLHQLPGIGRKTAERLIIDMRDRLADWQHESGTKSPGSAQTTSSAQQNVEVEEAISALVALGYKPTQAKQMIQTLEREGQTREALIRAALRQQMRQTA